MNERIDLLALQALDSKGGLDRHKFALLIVRECARVAFNDWCEGTNESSSEMAILKHFGVQE